MCSAAAVDFARDLYEQKFLLTPIGDIACAGSSRQNVSCEFFHELFFTRVYPAAFVFAILEPLRLAVFSMGNVAYHCLLCLKMMELSVVYVWCNSLALYMLID